MDSSPDVFSEAKLGPVTLRNRVIKAATFEASTPDALVTDDLINYHRLPAAGGVGMTTVAYCAVSPGGRTDGWQIWMRPEAVPGLLRLTDAIHAEGAAISAQIGHAGPVANARTNKAKALAPVRFFNPLSMRFAKKATIDDIREVTAAHANAARLAIDSGFDAVEVHLGHNYLASSFLSPLINRRSDEFGGSLENRAKVARGVVRAVRDAVDSYGAGKIAVTAKMNMSDGVRGGISLDESLQTAKWLEEDGALDAIELTAGSSLVNPMYLFRGDAPVKEFAANFKPPISWGIRMSGHKFFREYPYREAYLLREAKQFRAELKMPLILLGGITNRKTMDLAMSEGFEFVAMGRALLAEPDLINRIKNEKDGQNRVVSKCTHCNRCMPTIYSHTHCVVTGAPDALVR
ncbi:2,4-dienoyl-CoA reductase-like NADH-dependent reductase (Old Yellow Enzyme family) [Mycobacterium frederiksbergense]|uniref:2,4-dienoyl-CoA reductase-like NADH-dependent reductase (Old Yellow Enzyme family) n=1 Tax=Mycolicibacterium frederiksbergense TaxID=117567 RepID=A0ABT6L1U2_9MYCO|nr:NADH:flavin oxidoreductase [Mycolicibacterium frederiksbergense]MDH6196926.1 2,4-dienoyl-CoA reductase-like NADH-dependent reductase (Old Yellow Enzyme family) [Mycolicibacterium frederiksbergense]